MKHEYLIQLGFEKIDPNVYKLEQGIYQVLLSDKNYSGDRFVDGVFDLLEIFDYSQSDRGICVFYIEPLEHIDEIQLLQWLRMFNIETK